MADVIGVEGFDPGERGPGAAALTIPSQGEARDRALRGPADADPPALVGADCPSCRSAGSVTGGFCQVCYADLPAAPPRDDRGTTTAADLPPAAGRPVPPLRFADVIDELRAAASIATDQAAPASVTEACRRLEELLEHLRRQFLVDVGLAEPPIARSVPPG
jgi:hypothetical protein